MVVFDSSLHEVRIFKNRGYKIPKTINLKFGEFAFVSGNESKMELIQFSYIKRFLKKLLKKRRKIKSKGKSRTSQKAENGDKIKNTKIWVNLLPNYILSKKSKNSRMGKGKGGFLRWTFRLQQGTVLFEFVGIPYYKLLYVLLKIKKKLNLKILLIKKKKNPYFTCWDKFNTTLMYFDKYRYM